MMTQYLRAKSEHPEAVLLFRMGDFYETFFEDARILAEVTGIALTSRNPHDADPIPLAGFPWHSAEPQIGKLLRAGHRVAICEQVEEPGAGKKLLERRVVEVLSPGTTLGDSLLEARANNFLVALRVEGDRLGLAAADVSTGELRIGDLTFDEAAEEWMRLIPTEVLVPDSDRALLDPWLARLAIEARPLRTDLEAWRFGRDRAVLALLRQLGVVTLEGFECEDLGPALGAAGALLDYVREQKQSELGHIRKLVRIRPAEGLLIDESTLRSLEVLEGLPGANKSSTLLGVLDRTRTSAGARRLRADLRRPLTLLEDIVHRQNAVEALLEESGRASLRALLFETADLERILGRLHCGRSLPRDLGALRQTLQLIPGIESCRQGLVGADALPSLEPDVLSELSERLERALVEEPPAMLHDGGVFRDDWDPELAELRSLSRDGKGWIAALQQSERHRTAIPTLKVGFHRVFGYFIEVTQSQLAKVPEDYQRKQTLAGAERFVTPELKEFERKVLSAEEGQIRREKQLFEALCSEVRNATGPLQAVARTLASLDCLAALAESAARGRWVRPEMTNDLELTIEDGRHPVVEEAIGSDRFVPNDVALDATERQLVILTGPNMAGKSTYLRQIGLLVLLAQVGSFVPARAARIGIADRIFTRVGAQDSLARGQSTFLVEMIETSRILRHASARSLVLLDEVGRGTSTYDGLAIAWAVAEALSDVAGMRPRTVFATHFHELTRLAKPGNGVVNQNVQVKEWEGRVIFLHRIAEGGADRSYGIHVAQLAGVPDAVVQRAQEVLAQLERRGSDPAPTRAPRERSRQLSLFGRPEPAFLNELRALDLDRMAPLDALAAVHRWQSELRTEDGDAPGRPSA